MMSGQGLWIIGHGGATACNANTNGILLRLVWVLQTMPVYREPEESPKSIVHLPGAFVAGEHGCEA